MLRTQQLPLAADAAHAEEGGDRQASSTGSVRRWVCWRGRSERSGSGHRRRYGAGRRAADGGVASVAGDGGCGVAGADAARLGWRGSPSTTRSWPSHPSGRAHVISSAGALLWPLLDGVTTAGELASDVADVFGIDGAVALADVLRFVDDMVALDLVRVPPDSHGTRR